MVEIKDMTDSFDKIKLFSSDEEKLKLLGELLSNKSSRGIIQLLMNGEYYTNEIADKLNLRPNLVIHHLKKLEALGLLLITEKQITKKGNYHRFFTIIPHLFISPGHTEDRIKEKETLRKIFKETVKFVVIGLVGIISFFFTGGFNQSELSDIAKGEMPDLIEMSPLIIPLILTIIGLLVIYFTKKKTRLLICK